MAKKKLLTPEQEQILRDQVFDLDHPGPILREFQLVLEYVGEKGVKAGGKYNLLPIEGIIALDPLLSRPLNLPLERPQLKSHPYLQGLHILLCASGISQIEGKGDKARLALAPDRLAVWNDIGPTEKYFALLEAWLILARASMVGEREGWERAYFSDVLSAWDSLLHKQVRRSPNGGVGLAGFYRRHLHLALLDLFGLAEVTFPKTPTIPWEATRIAPRPFGVALMSLLGKDEEDFDEDDAIGFGQFQPSLSPYFPQYQRTLALPKPDLRKGVFVFHVSLTKSVWRRLALRAEDTLDDLLVEILDSVDFDNDHLYEFTYRDHMGRTARVGSPDDDEGVAGTEVQLGELPLKEGETMDLLYDFGDDWRFKVKLEKVEAEMEGELPRLLEKHGKAPEQYPSWDE